MSENTNRPTRLDIRDLPRDESRVLGGLRAALVKTFNYVRRYPAKLALLEQTLRAVHERVREEQKKAEARAAEAEKAAEIARKEAAAAEQEAKRIAAAEAKLAKEQAEAKAAADALAALTEGGE